MSFSFGFSGDDIEDSHPAIGATNQLESLTQTNSKQHLLASKSHTLKELLESLPSQVSYNYLQIDSLSDARNGQGNAINIPRRSLFDIRQQLMAEVDPTVNTNENLLSGLDQGDLTSGVYEGGFKTWECALDLASLVQDTSVDGGLHVIELGAGSAVPSLVLLNKVLRTRMKSPREEQDWPNVHFTLCDYNEDVLRLGTAVNVFLTTILAEGDHMRSKYEDGESNSPEDDMDLENINEELITACVKRLAELNISFNFISGAWGPDLVTLVRLMSTEKKNLVLSSETIYSPDSLPAFCQILVNLLKRDDKDPIAWIAAKKVYFGVGGGVQEFTNRIVQFGVSVKTIMEIKTSGVGRVVLEVKS